MRKMTTKEACGNRQVVSLPRIVKIMDLVSILRGNGHNGFPVIEHTRSGETLVGGLMLQSENEISGRTAGCPSITTSYDYDDFDEYGLPGQPKYSHLLKELHRAIKLCECSLVSALPTGSCILSENRKLCSFPHKLRQSISCKGFIQQ